MKQLSNNTLMGVVVATLLSSAGAIYAASTKIITLTNQVDDNTYELAGVVKSLELSRIDRQISNAEAEIRELDRYLLGIKEKPPLLISQRAALEAEIKRLGIIRGCISDGGAVCE